MKEAGVEAVKLEGGHPAALQRVRALVQAGIPVMGHLGFVPQSVHVMGGYRVQGRRADDADRLVREAKALEEAGCFSLVLELVTGEVAEKISRSLTIPTIGIGAGVGCDGQVLVLPDLLGLNPGFTPRFLKRYADLTSAARDGVVAFLEDVRARRYPGSEHTFGDEG
jgi:3-methyl-2-oxobutanoate hydroxymethyltransferase